jgi:hypothetical protein
VLTKGDPLLVTGTVDVPWGDSENPRERLRFVDAKLLTSIRAERSTMMDVRLNADLLKRRSAVAPAEAAATQFPRKLPDALALGDSAAKRDGVRPWATTSRSRRRMSCWPSWSRCSGIGWRWGILA